MSESSTPPNKPNDRPQPLFKIRPVFIHKMAVIEALIVAAFGSIFMTIVGGTALLIVFAIIQLDHVLPTGFPFWLCFWIGLIGLPVLFYKRKKKRYRTNGFHFYPDRIVYKSGIFFEKKDRIPFEQITGVMARANVIQRFFGLTTVYVAAPARKPAFQFGVYMGVPIADIPERDNWETVISKYLMGEPLTAPSAAAPLADE